MALSVALQVYSVRDYLEKDFRGTLEKVKQMGYEGVEFAGLYGNEPESIKQMLEEIGLQAASAHVPVQELLGNMTQTVAAYKTIGCKYIAIPWLEEERRPGHPGYAQTLEDIRAIGEEAKRQGITLLYHNHDFEFVKVDGQYALDMMYDMIPTDILQTEIDTCWVNVGGENPAEYIRKYTGRAPVVHLKDFVMPGKKPARMYELIGVNEEEGESEEAVFEFRPVGYGTQDFAQILIAANDVGAQWIIVEQDMPSMGKTSIECAQMSIDYLKNMK
ncbi:MAG: sugar phosphate isomerase/epimerase family protein [Cellulosilyticaceae bacterium]